jgi:(2Fe-2S) ferredoxin
MMPRINSALELERLREEIREKRDPNKPLITLCSGTACLAYGSKSVSEAFERELKEQGLEDEIQLKRTGCHGFCERGPLVVIYPEETCYTNVQPEDAAEIVQSVKERRVIERLLYTDPTTGQKITKESEIPFYKNQQRIVLGTNKWIDPRNIEDYLYLGGYSALTKVLFQMSRRHKMGGD